MTLHAARHEDNGEHDSDDVSDHSSFENAEGTGRHRQSFTSSLSVLSYELYCSIMALSPTLVVFQLQEHQWWSL